MYSEKQIDGLVTIRLECDAWAVRGKYVCNNYVEATAITRKVTLQIVLDLGWRLLRGNQVCPDCLKSGKVSFPRKVK